MREIVILYVKPEQKMDWKEYIESTPEVLRGKPRIKNTRIPVSLILGYLADDYSSEEIISEFPGLKKDHISACLHFARDLSEYELAA